MKTQHIEKRIYKTAKECILHTCVRIRVCLDIHILPPDIEVD